MRALFGQFVRFGVVGLVGVVVDVGIFNLLRLTVLAPELIHEGPVIAKVISTSIAIATNWIGNRYWTFGSMRRSHVLREGLEFALVSVGGMAIALLCLWISHYLLGFTSALASHWGPRSASPSTASGCSVRNSTRRPPLRRRASLRPARLTEVVQHLEHERRSRHVPQHDVVVWSEVDFQVSAAQ